MLLICSVDEYDVLKVGVNDQLKQLVGLINFTHPSLLPIHRKTNRIFLNLRILEIKFSQF